MSTAVMESQETVSTIAGDEQIVSRITAKLDLSELPPVFVLPTHMEAIELDEIEDQLRDAGAPLTYDPLEAQLFLGKVTQKRRAVLELRSRGVSAEEAALKEIVTELSDDGRPTKKRRTEPREPPRKQVHEDDSSTESEPGDITDVLNDRPTQPSPISSPLCGIGQHSLRMFSDEAIVCVLKLEWLLDCLEKENLLPFQDYITFLGKRIQKPADSTISERLFSPSRKHGLSPTPQPPAATVTIVPKATAGQNILERALAEAPTPQAGPARSFASTSQLASQSHSRTSNRIAHLVHQSTSEHDYGRSTDLPELPDWVQRHSSFSCERATPLHGPNDRFVDELKKIRLARTLTSDEIGVRAYSSSIASLAAYPYTITDQREILALPGCDHKISALWVEWKNKNGFIQAAHDAENDEYIKNLQLFYDIWGVGAHTARDFYARGWRDLDDIVEYGWHELSRVQQIGVKYYDEFLLKLSRAEVEFVGAKVHEHAQRVREPSGVRTCIVGGHRRGKTESGDVDIIVSHLDEEATLGIVEDIVKSLYDEGWITHELITHMSASRRGQATLPYRSGGGGHGFDTLDKALVVWQDPEWPGKHEMDADGDEDKDAKRKKNPNVHRRVDIIIAPWSKVGCAVLGWTAGTTFERDLRRYARKVKGWKFDSSGVRDRNTGVEVDLENIGGRCTTIDEAERRVFKGFGLEWREPWERNTG